MGVGRPISRRAGLLSALASLTHLFQKCCQPGLDDGVLGWVSDDSQRIQALLDLLDLPLHQLAQDHDPVIGRCQSLFGPIRDRSLALSNHVVLCVYPIQFKPGEGMKCIGRILEGFDIL